MRAVCLKHVPFEGPGAFAASLANSSLSFEYHLILKDGLPKDAGDLLIVMGGPMLTNDPDPSLPYQLVTFFPLASSSVDGSSLNTRSSGLNSICP